jgi:prolyl oligopeptidase
VRRDGKGETQARIANVASIGIRAHQSGPTHQGSTYRRVCSLAGDFEAFLKGERKLDILFQPTERTSLAGYSFTRHNLLVTELDNVHNRVYVLTHEKGEWRRRPLGDSPGFSTVNASGVDDRDSDDYWMTVNDYLSPTALYLGSVGKGSPEKLKELPAFFDAKGLEVSQHEATSKDGTRIPYFQVARKGLALDGNNPTLLYGYGGFEISMLPGYSGGVGAAWLEPGGAVVANIRGEGSSVRGGTGRAEGESSARA